MTSLRMAFVLVLSATAADAQLVTAGAHVLSQFHAGGLIEANDRFGAALAAGDFDGDGTADLAVGVPGEGVGAIAAAGGVVVFYGSRDGLGNGTRAAIGLHQDVPGVEDVAEVGDRFGAAVAAGDIDGDGFDDLVVGVPYEDLAGLSDTGALHVFFGGPTGIDPAGDQWLPNTSLAGAAGDRFAAALVACDKTGDGDDDVAVGSPGRDAGAGMAWVFIATGTGLVTTGAQVLYADESEQGDELGISIACGDIDLDGVLDFLVGAPYGEGADEGSVSSGAAWYFNGLGGTSQKIAPGATDERWGSAVAIGYFNPSGEATMLVGGPAASWNSEQDGAVLTTGLLGGSFRTQEDPVFAEASEPFDGFGGVFAIGDFDHDGLDDAVFGVPGENLFDGTDEVLLDAGVAHVLYGQAARTGTGTGQTWSWGGPIPSYIGLDNDEFGAALAVGDFDANGVDDLAIGAPGALDDGLPDTGWVQILYAWPPGWIFGDDFERGDPARWSSASGVAASRSKLP